MNKGGRPRMNPQFEAYVWLVIELLRDQAPPHRRRSWKEVCALFRETVSVDWANDTIKTHCRRAKERMGEHSTEMALLEKLRRWRIQRGWIDPADMLVALDREWRKHSRDAQG